MATQTHAPIKNTIIRTLKRGEKLTTAQIAQRTGLDKKRTGDTLRLWTCFTKTTDNPTKWYYNNQPPNEHTRKPRKPKNK